MNDMFDVHCTSDEDSNDKVDCQWPPAVNYPPPAGSKAVGTLNERFTRNHFLGTFLGVFFGVLSFSILMAFPLLIGALTDNWVASKLPAGKLRAVWLSDLPGLVWLAILQVGGVIVAIKLGKRYKVLAIAYGTTISLATLFVIITSLWHPLDVPSISR